jgi:hypothetical protein
MLEVEPVANALGVGNPIRDFPPVPSVKIALFKSFRPGDTLQDSGSFMTVAGCHKEGLSPFGMVKSLKSLQLGIVEDFYPLGEGSSVLPRGWGFINGPGSNLNQLCDKDPGIDGGNLKVFFK